MKKNKKNFTTEQNDQYIIKEQKDESVQSLLKQKRKNSFESKEQLEEEQSEEINFCKFCKTKIGTKDLQLLNNLKNNDFANIINNEKMELNNSNSDSLNNILINNDDDEKKKKLFFFKNLKKCCGACIQKIIKNREMSNINLSNNYIYNIEEELKMLKLVLSKNNEVETKIKEIINDLDYFKEEKNINNNNKNTKIISIKNNLIENYDKLKEIKNYLEDIIEKKNLFINENESLNNLNNIKNIEKNDLFPVKKNEKKEGFKISSQNIINYIPKYQSKSESPKSYAILTKGFIYESKYEKMKKNNLSKTFQYNSFNQFKNYIHNFPILINKNSNNNNGKNINGNNNLINSLSDIKNLENNSTIKKSKLNSMAIPVKYQSLEVEKPISKIKELDNNKTSDINKKNVNNKGFNNNNSLDIEKYNDNNENNLNNKNILLKYLVSSYQINQKLLSQINFRINPISNVINGINNSELLNELLNLNKIDGNINTIQNSINNAIINPLMKPMISDNSKNFSSLNNQINGNFNFFNNMQSLYNQNQNLLNNNLNRINIGTNFNYLNDISDNQKLLYNNTLRDLKMFNNNMIANTFNNNSNPCFDIKNVPGVNLTNSFLIENMIKNDNNNINESMNKNNKESNLDVKPQQSNEDKKD